jgi:hypothetical protein
MRKLEESTKSNFSSSLQEIGSNIAQKISLTAKEVRTYFGDSSWIFDSTFAILLVVMHVNHIKIFKR